MASSFARFGLALIGMALAGWLVYSLGLSGGFIFDDFPNLVYDSDWKVQTLAWNELYRAAFGGIASDAGRPLALLSFAMNHYFSGLDPYWMKVTSLVMHLVNGVLVFWLSNHIFRFVSLDARPQERIGLYAAAMVAMAWLLHPLQVSTVLYVVQRMEVGAATGTLLALLAYWKGRTTVSGRRSWGWYGLSVLAMIFGLGFKETTLLTPGYALALEISVLRFRRWGGRTSVLLAWFWVLMILAALLLFVFQILPHVAQPRMYAIRDFTLAERLLTQLHVLLVYLGQIVLPSPDRLLFYYDNFPISRALHAPVSTLFGLLVLSGLVAGAWVLRNRFPLIVLGVAWFLVGHSLTSNVWPLELAFEHRNYLPLLGILIALTQVLVWLTCRLHMDARRTLALLPIGLLAVLCSLQTSAWGDPFRLATALATRNPDSVRASYGLGTAMLEVAGENYDSPLVDLAIKEFEHASALSSRSALPEQALVITLSRLGREIPDRIWLRLREKIGAGAAGPSQIGALHGVLECRLKELCVFDDHQLFLTFVTAIEMNPRSAVIHSLYANFAWGVLGDGELGIAMMREATMLAPRDMRFKTNLVRFLEASGMYPEELEALQKQVGVIADNEEAGEGPGS